MLDNSLSMGRGNLAICRETIKYVLDNADKEYGFSLTLIGEDRGVLGDCGDTRETLKEKLSKVGLIDSEPLITDNLTEILLDLRHNREAQRCVLFFSDGIEKESLRHEKEELYFLLETSDIPSYVIDCVTKESCIKKPSSIATISGGELLYTDFKDSEAEVEKKLGDKILGCMRSGFKELTVSEEKAEIKSRGIEGYPAEAEDYTNGSENEVRSYKEKNENEILLYEEENGNEIQPYKEESEDEAFKLLNVDGDDPLNIKTTVKIMDNSIPRNYGENEIVYKQERLLKNTPYFFAVAGVLIVSALVLIKVFLEKERKRKRKKFKEHLQEGSKSEIRTGDRRKEQGSAAAKKELTDKENIEENRYPPLEELREEYLLWEEDNGGI